MRADLLDQRLSELDAAGELERVKLLYVCSYFDNPTGLTLSAQRRRDVMGVVQRWRKKHHFYVLEDAAYRDLVINPEDDVPSMKMLDEDNSLVILAQTFSKPLAPGLKTGYGFLPDDLLGPVMNQKGSHDFGSANLCQHIIHRLLASGEADRHIEVLREAYRAKRDAMLEALAEHLGDLKAAGQVDWTEPGGGLYVWLTLPEAINTDLKESLFQRCLEAGVLYVPGGFCFFAEPGRPVPQNHIRLSFGVPSVDENREGVRRLAQAIREELT
jgi:2-aminoadipate transaminase